MKTFEVEFMGIYIGSDKNYTNEYRKHTLLVCADDHKSAIAMIGRRSDYSHSHVYKVNGRYVNYCGEFQTWMDNPKSEIEILAAKTLRGERW